MTGSLGTAYLHLVFTVFLVGYALYWATMVVALRRTCSPDESLRLLAVANAARWPHVVIPWTLRLPLPFVGWAFLGILLASGAVLASESGWPALLVVKLVLVAALALVQVILTRRPVPALIFASFALVLGIVVLSALLVRI
jgi:hypothetical protein